jgi:hypothetical protein
MAHIPTVYRTRYSEYETEENPRAARGSTSAGAGQIVYLGRYLCKPINVVLDIGYIGRLGHDDDSPRSICSSFAHSK